MLQALHPRWRGEISVPYKQSNKVSLSAQNQPHLRLLDILDACRGGNTAWKVEILTVLLTFFHHHNSRTTSSLSHLLPKPLSFPGFDSSLEGEMHDIMKFLWKILQWLCESHVGERKAAHCFLWENYF